MEKLIVYRLEPVLERKQVFAEFQCGFRKGHNTMDNLSNFERFVSMAVNNKGIAVALFLDFSKAFDRIWVDGVYSSCLNWGLHGNILNWVRDYLNNRSFQVRIGDTLSDTYFLDNGVPQGGCLSPLLFNIMMHDFPSLQTDSFKSIFADDCNLCRSGKNLESILSVFQHEIEKGFHMG